MLKMALKAAKAALKALRSLGRGLWKLIGGRGRGGGNAAAAAKEQIQDQLEEAAAPDFVEEIPENEPVSPTERFEMGLTGKDLLAYANAKTQAQRGKIATRMPMEVRFYAATMNPTELAIVQKSTPDALMKHLKSKDSKDHIDGLRSYHDFRNMARHELAKGHVDPHPDAARKVAGEMVETRDAKLVTKAHVAPTPADNATLKAAEDSFSRRRSEHRSEGAAPKPPAKMFRQANARVAV
jgi:hypothetical protein